MRPWARWAARTALVAVGLAAAGGGLPGSALAAATGGSPGGVSLLGGGSGDSGDSGDSGSGGSGGLLGPGSVPAQVCGDAGALLGIAVAACRAATDKPDGAGLSGGGSSAGGSQGRVPASSAAGVCSNAATVLGASAAGCAGGPQAGGPGTSSASTGPQHGARAGSASSVLRQTFGDTLNAPGLGAGNTHHPPASQRARLGTLPGLADLSSVAGLNALAPAPGHGDGTGSSLPMPGSALSAADTSGMSSDSFAVLALGALLGGAAALKIANRRARDRKAGIGATK
jgi:hypothetical protein